MPNDKFENNVSKLFVLSDSNNTNCTLFITFHQNTHCATTNTERYQNTV